MSKYISADRLVAAVCIALALELFLTVAQSGALLLQMHLLTRVQNGEQITDAEASLNDLRIQVISVATLVVAAVCGILFFKFLGRANHNATALGAEDISATPGWTIGYFFVPVVNLWRPYQILQEIWKASAPESGPWQNRPGSSLIGWWWALRLVDLVANRIMRQINMRPGVPEPTIQQLIDQTWATIGVLGLDFVLLVLSFLLVRQLHQRQLARLEAVGEAESVQCPNCGEQLGHDIIFEITCPLCGATVKPETALNPA